MNRKELIEDFLKTFKPKEEQAWKSCYFFAYYLKKNHDIDAKLIEGISSVNKIDHWIVRFNGKDEDIHAKAVGLTPDLIENPEIIWSLEDFERDNF
tara:strand:+ start:417 stop:704 length:288 start_codon:yes stop_codon:yes gene_type:complete